MIFLTLIIFIIYDRFLKMTKNLASFCHLFYVICYIMYKQPGYLIRRVHTCWMCQVKTSCIRRTRPFNKGCILTSVIYLKILKTILKIMENLLVQHFFNNRTTTSLQSYLHMMFIKQFFLPKH